MSCEMDHTLPIFNLKSTILALIILISSVLSDSTSDFVTDVYAMKNSGRFNVHCPGLSIPNGRVNIRSRGRTAKFVCVSGYQMLGRRYITCVRGHWNADPPLCISRGCPPLDLAPHSQMTPEMRGALARFKCDPGYGLTTWPVLVCNGMHWNASAPTCQSLMPNPPLSCDFEREELCGWSQDATDDFDWKRFSSSTPSGHIGTGPSQDHTYGTDKDGFYLYIEASSPRKENDRARLYSPVYTTEQLGNDSCFVLWYHMFGANTGSLSIYVKPESKDLASVAPVWQNWGDRGNQWHVALVQLVYVTESLQIIVEGIRGSGYSSDTAIDDVSIRFGADCREQTITDPPSTEGPMSSYENSQPVDLTTLIYDPASASQEIPVSSDEPFELTTNAGSMASAAILGVSDIPLLPYAGTESGLPASTVEDATSASNVTSLILSTGTSVQAPSTGAPSSVSLYPIVRPKQDTTQSGTSTQTPAEVPLVTKGELPAATTKLPDMSRTYSQAPPLTNATPTMKSIPTTEAIPVPTSSLGTKILPITIKLPATISTTTTKTTTRSTAGTTNRPTTTTTATRPTTTTTTTRPTTTTTTTRPTTTTTTTRPTTTTTTTRPTTETTTTRATTTTSTPRPTTTTSTPRPTTTTTKTSTRPTTTTTAKRTTTRPTIIRTTKKTTTRPITIRTTKFTTTRRIPPRPTPKRTTVRPTLKPPPARPTTTTTTTITRSHTTASLRPSIPFLRTSQSPISLPSSSGIMPLSTRPEESIDETTDLPNDILTVLPTVNFRKDNMLAPWDYLPRRPLKPARKPQPTTEMDNHLNPSAHQAQANTGGTPVPVSIAIALGALVSLVVIAYAGRSIYRRRKAKQDSLTEDSDVRYLTSGEIRVEFFDRN